MWARVMNCREVGGSDLSLPPPRQIIGLLNFQRVYHWRPLSSIISVRSVSEATERRFQGRRPASESIRAWKMDASSVLAKMRQLVPNSHTRFSPPHSCQPVESKKKASKGVYVCPTYMYPLRTGSRERPSFVIAAELRAGKHPSEFWTKRGVAMLLSIGA